MHMPTYNQEAKREARKKLLEHAVFSLTRYRQDACCVRRTYVRELRDYFVNDVEGENGSEASKIPDSYIKEWEIFHDICVGKKEPRDLKVCYLAGPEPLNDFELLLSLGVLPQNIWAFESGRNEFAAALSQCAGTGFGQPKLYKMNIEHFFEAVPVVFDIVYLDFCSTFISSRHALRCVAKALYYHRIRSPGALVTNFSIDDEGARDELSEVMARHFILKGNAGKAIHILDRLDWERVIRDESERVSADFEHYYGDFITDVISNVAATIVPAQRLQDTGILNLFIASTLSTPELSLGYLDSTKSDLSLRFLACYDLRIKDHPLFCGNDKMRVLTNELTLLNT